MSELQTQDTENNTEPFLILPEQVAECAVAVREKLPPKLRESNYVRELLENPLSFVENQLSLTRVTTGQEEHQKIVTEWREKMLACADAVKDLHPNDHRLYYALLVRVATEFAFRREGKLPNSWARSMGSQLQTPIDERRSLRVPEANEVRNSTISILDAPQLSKFDAFVSGSKPSVSSGMDGLSEPRHHLEALAAKAGATIINSVQK